MEKYITPDTTYASLSEQERAEWHNMPVPTRSQWFWGEQPRRPFPAKVLLFPVQPTYAPLPESPARPRPMPPPAQPKPRPKLNRRGRALVRVIVSLVRMSRAFWGRQGAVIFLETLADAARYDLEGRLL